MSYYLFFGQCHYPKGGIADLKGRFETIGAAIEFSTLHEFDWAHVANDDFEVIKVWSESLSTGSEIFLGDGKDEGESVYQWIDGGLNKERTFKYWHELPEWDGSMSYEQLVAHYRNRE